MRENIKPEDLANLDSFLGNSVTLTLNYCGRKKSSTNYLVVL